MTTNTTVNSTNISVLGNALKKIKAIREFLNKKYVERTEIIDALLVALLSGEHALLVGSPGTAKSDLIRDLVKLVQGSTLFDYLFTKYTTPDEVFGPLKLTMLQQDVFERKVEGFLPTAEFAFLDEIFKSNSAILNALLTLLNERIYHNGINKIDCPLITTFGASNEYPEDTENLSALFDRFLIRVEPKYIAEPANFLKMMRGALVDPPEALTKEELTALQNKAGEVLVEPVLLTINEIREKLKNEGIQPSDRRFRKSLPILQAKALLSGHMVVKPSDLSIMQHILWERPEQRDKVKSVVDTYSIDRLHKDLQDRYAEAQDIYEEVKNNPTPDAIVEASLKLQNIVGHLSGLQNQNQYKSRLGEIQQVLNDVLKAKNLIETAVGLGRVGQ